MKKSCILLGGTCFNEKCSGIDSTAGFWGSCVNTNNIFHFLMYDINKGITKNYAHVDELYLSIRLFKD